MFRQVPASAFFGSVIPSFYTKDETGGWMTTPDFQAAKRARRRNCMIQAGLFLMVSPYDVASAWQT